MAPKQSRASFDVAISGASWLLVLSILQKAVSFGINTLIFRSVHVETAGAAAVQLELGLSSALILREGWRLAALRSLPSDNGNKTQMLTNLSWLFMVPLGLVLTYVFLPWSLLTSSSNTTEAGWTTTVWLYTLAASLEWIIEPLVLLAHSNLFFKWRLRAESAAFVTRALVQYVSTVLLSQGLISYGYAQVAFALTLLIIYSASWVNYISYQDRASEDQCIISFQNLLPCKESMRWIDWNRMRLNTVLTLQAGLKHLLTEGDKLVLAFSSSLYDMGVYGIAFHYGSLAPRIVFLPLEDASKAIFSQVDRKKLGQASNALVMMVKLVAYIGLCFACFGPAYTFTLIRLLMGEAKSSTTEIPVVLGWYCLYVLFLALNGVLEAFVHSTASQRQLMVLNVYLVGFFSTFVISTLIFMQVLHVGTVGLVWANCVNMLCRILYSLIYVNDFFKDSPISFSSMLPALPVIGFLCGAFGLTQLSQKFWLSSLSNPLVLHVSHVACGAVCFVTFVLISWKYDQVFWRQVMRFKKDRHKKEV